MKKIRLITFIVWVLFLISKIFIFFLFQINSFYSADISFISNKLLLFWFLLFPNLFLHNRKTYLMFRINFFYSETFLHNQNKFLFSNIFFLFRNIFLLFQINFCNSEYITVILNSPVRNIFLHTRKIFFLVRIYFILFRINSFLFRIKQLYSE